MRMQRMPCHLPELEMGLDSIPLHWDVGITPSFCTPSGHYKGHPGELVQSSGTDLTLDNVLSILDKHYNNVKALDALNQELFQLQMVDKETVLDWGVYLSRHLLILAASFPECFPPDCMAELKHDRFYSSLPKHLKVMVAYLKANPQEKTHSDYLWAVREGREGRLHGAILKPMKPNNQ